MPQRSNPRNRRQTLNPARLLASLHRIALAVAVIPETGALGQMVAEEVRDLVQADRAAIFVWDDATSELRATVAVPEGPAIPAIAPGSGAVGLAFAERRPVSLDDYPSTPNALPSAIGVGVRAVAAVPLLSAREPVGVLAAWRFSPGEYTAEQVEVLSLLGTLGLAPAFEAAILRRRGHERYARLAIDQLLEPSPAGNPQLTPREREILPLLAQGQTNREIGTLLHISPGTVRNLVARLQAKLGARDRTHLVVLALERGLL